MSMFPSILFCNPCPASRTSSYPFDHIYRPTDLLDSESQPHTLKSYSTITSAEPVYAISIYPFFNLQDPSTTVLLSTPRDHPIRLTSLLYPTTLATYPLILPATEAYVTPHSILWTSTGTNFLTGSDSVISIFDVSRVGEGPVVRLKTIPS